jgi:acyl carrier protein
MTTDHTATVTLPERVRAAWRQSLGRDDFTETDNFFQVGGQSLRAMQVMKHLGGELGVRLPARLLFDNPTVERLSAAVRAYVDEADVA